MELLTAAQMRAIEQAAIDSGEVTGLELMERAGAGVVEAIFEWRPELAEGKRHALVLCGPGNNGGDGFVVARLLKERGWGVEVFLYGDEAKLPRDAAENCRRWRELGEGIERELPYDPDEPIFTSVIIDALFGIGFDPHRSIDAAATLETVFFADDDPNWWEGNLVSIDVPTGLSGDSGVMLDCFSAFGRPPLRAALTVTFHCPKLGHYTGDGPRQCGHLDVRDIGLGKWEHKFPSQATTLVDKRVVRSSNHYFWAHPWHLGQHKYSHGHALIVSGGMAKTGAARLAARGALRVGAGLVTVASPPNALMENAAHLTAIMLQKMKGPEGLADILSDERINAVVIGPACGVGEETRALVNVALTSERTVILDADALTSFADDPETLFTAIKASSCSVILTPHGGEFARLFLDIAAKLAEPPTKGPAFSKVDATREAATRSGATVLYKGADTVIAEPNGRCSIAAAVYERAAPWLATAGSGDVLAGMIAGLAARGSSDAAASAAWLHQECGRHLGPGLIAEDIPEAIPSVLKRVLDWQPPAQDG